jgi:hypothetical protein
MKTKNVTIWLIAAVLVVWLISSSEVSATVTYDDGGVHNINFVIDELVEVWDSSSGDVTTVNLVSGGSIKGDGLYAHDHSQINVSGGFIDGGSIKYNLKAYDNSQIDISGGSIGNYLYATDNSEVTLSGGFIAANLEAHFSSNVIITGGSIGFFYGGGHGWDLMAYNNSEVTISGGMIAYDLHAFDNTQVTISGGSIGHDLYAKNSSQVSISGGVLGRLIVAGEPPESHSVITIDGSGFNYPFGVIADSSGTLTGTLINGKPINNDFMIYDGASIVLVPEPATVLLLGFGAVRLRSRQAVMVRRK